MKGKFWRFLKAVTHSFVRYAFFLGFFLHSAIVNFSDGNQLSALVSSLIVLISLARMWHYAMRYTLVKVETSAVERMLEEVVKE